MKYGRVQFEDDLKDLTHLSLPLFTRASLQGLESFVFLNPKAHGKSPLYLGEASGWNRCDKHK